MSDLTESEREELNRLRLEKYRGDLVSQECMCSSSFTHRGVTGFVCFRCTEIREIDKEGLAWEGLT